MKLHRRALPALALATGLLVAACTPTSQGAHADAAGAKPATATPMTVQPPTMPPSATAIATTASAIDRLAADLDGRLAAAFAGKNRVFSPASLSAALAMTYAGARGKTADEMRAALHFDALGDDPTGAPLHEAWQGLLAAWTVDDPKGASIHVANRLFGQSGFAFDPAFVALTRDRYGAPLQSLDFMAAAEPSRAAINDWVDAQTAHRIVGLLDAGTLDPSTRLVLVNAMHFQGAWTTPFQSAATHPAPFALAGATSVDVPTMHGSLTTRYLDTATAQIVALPFASPGGQHDLELDVVVPKGAGPALDGADRYGALGAQLDAAPTTMVSLAMPRFRVQSHFELAPLLAELGMPSAFSETRAYFSGIDGKRDLYVSHVVHQAMLDVNENGAEAAAATAVVMTEKGAALMPTQVVKVDRAFDAVLRDRKTGAVLFVAHVADPR